MNIEKLMDAERRFLERYPGGFQHPDMQEIYKKHRIVKMTGQAQAWFPPDGFDQPEAVVERFSKMVGQSSMVSVFEKAKFRDFLKGITAEENDLIAEALRQMLHDDAAAGFALLSGLLGHYKMAKWPLLTALPYYYRPNGEVLVKPTAVRTIQAYYELDGPAYRPTPDYAFYRSYRDQILGMKPLLKGIQAENAGFCGFLMMGAGEWGEI